MQQAIQEHKRKIYGLLKDVDCQVTCREIVEAYRRENQHSEGVNLAVRAADKWLCANKAISPKALKRSKAQANRVEASGARKRKARLAEAFRDDKNDGSIDVWRG